MKVKVKFEYIVLGLLSLLVLVHRLVTIGSVDELISDEVYYVNSARSILFAWRDPNLEHPPLFKLLLALSISIFGDNPLGWRMISYLSTITIILLTYLIGKELVDVHVGIASSIFVALDTTMFSMSIGMMELFVTALMLSSLYFVIKKRYATASIFSGLAISTKYYAVTSLVPLTLSLLGGKDRFKNISKFVYAIPFLIFSATCILMDLNVSSPLDRITYGLHYHSSLLVNDPRNVAVWEWFTYPSKPFLFYASKGLILITAPNPVINSLAIVTFLTLTLVKRDRKFLLCSSYYSYVLPFMFLGRVQYAYYVVPLIPLSYVGSMTALRCVLDLVVGELRGKEEEDKEKSVISINGSNISDTGLGVSLGV